MLRKKQLEIIFLFYISIKNNKYSLGMVKHLLIIGQTILATRKDLLLQHMAEQPWNSMRVAPEADQLLVKGRPIYSRLFRGTKVIAFAAFE